MARQALLETRTDRDIARKAGIQSVAGSGPLPTVIGTFSFINSADGYELEYPSGDYSFPDGTASMTSVVDLAELSEARLLATVASGGDAGVTLTVTGAGEDIAVDLEAIPGEELIVGSWHPVSGEMATLEWTVSAPDVGSAIMGLCQLQAR